jgi:hypothetical protein
MLVGRLDAAGYARVKHWRVYAEEGLARREVAVWLGDEEMAFEYAGRTLSRYDVSLSRDAAKLEAITNPRLFATPYQRSRPELRLFDLQDSLGDAGWLKALRLKGYAIRNRRRPEALQHPLFPYLEAL